MLYLIDMDIFSNVLLTRPPNFTTFNASGFVENGLSPSTNSAVTTASLGFLNAGFTHGANTDVIFSNGKFVYPGQQASFEFIVKNSALPNATADIVFSLGPSGEIHVQRTAAGGGTRYRLVATSPSGSVEADLYTSLIPSVDYVAFTVGKESFDLYVNGNSVSLAKPLDMPNLSSFSARASATKLVYYVVVRDYPMPREYHDAIYADLLDTFEPLSVEGFYNATSFIMDPAMLDEKEVIDLTDSLEPIYTAEPSDNYNMMPVPTEDGSFDITLGTTQYTGVDVPVIGTFTETNAPDEGLTSKPGGRVRLLGPSVIMPAANMPDRTATISPNSFFTWKDVMPAVYGSTVIDPDSQATTTAEYPTAYSMWVFLPTDTPGTIVSGGAISISASAGSITRAGLSQIYVDGVAGATTITPGWHNISFIPTTPQNATLALSSTSVGLASFAMLYDASPASYLVAMYNSYISRPKITVNDASAIVITESGTSVYAHKWAIKSVD